MSSVVTETRSPRTTAAGTRRIRRWRDALGWVFLALVLAVWAVTLRPTQLGGPATFVVVSGDSMEPTLHAGDLVVLRAQDSYDVGDIVAFPVPEGEPGEGILIIHRLVGADRGVWVPQGDNRDVADTWRPAEGDIRGELWVHVPRGGHRLMTFMQPPLLAALAGGGATMWFLLRDGRPHGRKDHDA